MKPHFDNSTFAALEAAQKTSREVERVRRILEQVEGHASEDLATDSFESIHLWKQKFEQPDWVKVEQSHLKEVEQAAGTLKSSQRRWFANAIDEWKAPRVEIAWQPKFTNEISDDWAASLDKWGAWHRSFQALDLGQHLVARHTAELKSARRSTRVREHGMSGWFKEFLPHAINYFVFAVDTDAEKAAQALRVATLRGGNRPSRPRSVWSVRVEELGRMVERLAGTLSPNAPTKARLTPRSARQGGRPAFSS